MNARTSYKFLGRIREAEMEHVRDTGDLFVFENRRSGKQCRIWESAFWGSRVAPDPLRARLTAFARDRTLNGDMTPTAARMLTRILKETK